MNKSTKLYVKALNKYNEGNIDRALELCEKSISLNVKNTPAINLKGLLYYLKGEIENAQALWKMNYQVNNDSVSRKYFDESKKDEDKNLIYLEALKLIQALKIREALELLSKCKESDYNAININNNIALCYIKLGDYDNALIHINEVLKIEKNNSMALQNKKVLMEYGTIKKEFDFKGMAFIAGAAVIVILIVLVIRFKPYKNIKLPSFNTKKTSNLSSKNQSYKNNNDAYNKEETPVINKEERIDLKTAEEERFPSDEIKQQLQSNDFDKLYDTYMKWHGKDLKINDKVLISKVQDSLINQGIQYFYKAGTQYLNQKDYQKGKDSLYKAYSLGNQNYLYPHIIYMLGIDYESMDDAENAIKYYSEYDSKFSKGDYEEIVLYQLAMLYKDEDVNKAKSYASRLAASYPDSMYNNSNTKEVLSK